jgi:hypothetical protein
VPKVHGVIVAVPNLHTVLLVTVQY